MAYYQLVVSGYRTDILSPCFVFLPVILCLRKAGEWVRVLRFMGMIKNMKNKIAVLGVLGTSVLSAFADTNTPDATAITSAASSAFTGVATLCVVIGTFFVVYKLVRRIR